jgi:predicted Rossmann-fold nucleotide-binding protein
MRGSVLAEGFISESDFDLVRVCDHPDEVIETIQKWYIKHKITGRKALSK